ncbi:MAG: hypothetical protein ABH879_01085 [archaeon]
MVLTKPMLEVLNLVIHGYSTIESIAETIKKSKNWVSEIVTMLENEWLIAKRKAFGIRKSRLSLALAATPHALKLKELLLEYNTIDFKEILAGVRLSLLTSLCLDWKDMKTASSQAGISMTTARIYTRNLINRGILQKNSRMYKVNTTAWPKLQEFLKEYRNFSTFNGTLKWKYKDEILLEIDNEMLKKGVYTGFGRYSDYGVRVNTIKVLCYVPEKQLSKEEIFVHSLFEINDSRTLYLALTFFLKAGLRRKKVEKMAMKYDIYTKFINLMTLLNTMDERMDIAGLPAFERSGLKRVMGLYGVKNV